MGTRIIHLKMAATTEDPLLLQANNLWKMLDDLADNDPDGYTIFMDRFLKRNQECFNPPEPFFCLKTHKLPESSSHHFFINICKWNEVLPLSKQKEKISVVASDLHELPNCGTKTSAIDICFNSDTMADIGDVNECKKEVAKIAIEYVEDLAGCKLSKAYKVLAVKYKGNTGNLKKFLFKLNRRPTPVETPSPCENEKQSVFHGLANIVKPQGMKEDPCGLLEDPKGSAGGPKVGGNDSNATKKPLIEELSPAVVKATQVPKHTIEVVKATQVPKHTIEVVKATTCSPAHVVIKVDLPKVCSGSECELDVSKDDLVLSTPHYSKLHVRLQETGDENKTTSTFNKMTHQLTVTIPVLL